ncbi:helix-turn-helix domain-containing protein [Candidatus Acetothermia bacterium]|nr:helix-turn-helix domain-containing protein [Candidatus Acetothermia bacterium]
MSESHLNLLLLVDICQQKVYHKFMITKRFGAHLRTLRQAKRIGQRELARRVNIEASRLCRIEQGERPPPLNRLGALAQALDVDLSELLALIDGGRELDQALVRLPRENRITGKIISYAAGIAVLQAGKEVIDIASAAELTIHDEVTIALSPRAVFLALQLQQSSARNKFRGMITAIKYQKGTARIDIDCGSFPLVSVITARSATEMDLTVGKEVYAFFKATAVSVLTLQDRVNKIRGRY